MSPSERRAQKQSRQQTSGQEADSEQCQAVKPGEDFNNNNNNSEQTKTIDGQNHSSIIDKLVSESADYLARGTSAYKTDAAVTIEMDPAKGRKKVSGSDAPRTGDGADSAPTNAIEASSKEQATIPSYSSIFNTSYYRKTSPNSPQLKKQPGALDYSEQSTLRMSTVEHNRKQFTSEQSYNGTNKPQELPSDDDNNEIIDERLPLSSAKINRPLNSKRISPTESVNSQQNQQQHHYNGNKRLQITNFDHYPITTNSQRCETNNQQHHNQQLAAGNRHSPHTKISFSADHHGRHNTHQPTSFSADHHHDGHFGSHARKLDWQESGSCLDCDCNNCYTKFKNAMSHESNCCRRSNDINGSSKSVSSKTKNLHMVLKSIILVLLTLLLLILFVGIIAASHYLPQVFDRLLSATRSFNVTIAG